MNLPLCSNTGPIRACRGKSTEDRVVDPIWTGNCGYLVRAAQVLALSREDPHNKLFITQITTLTETDKWWLNNKLVKRSIKKDEGVGQSTPRSLQKDQVTKNPNEILHDVMTSIQLSWLTSSNQVEPYGHPFGSVHRKVVEFLGQQQQQQSDHLTYFSFF